LNGGRARRVRTVVRSKRYRRPFSAESSADSVILRRFRRRVRVEAAIFAPSFSLGADAFRSVAKKIEKN